MGKSPEIPYQKAAAKYNDGLSTQSTLSSIGKDVDRASEIP